jgi:hypothetical protein
MDSVRTIAGAECPLLSWTPLPATAILRYFSPEKLGGLGDLKGKMDAEAARSGMSVEELAMTVSGHSCLYFETHGSFGLGKQSYYHQSSGQVVRIPGLPDAYDYEAFPQEVSPTALQPHIYFSFLRLLCTGHSSRGALYPGHSPLPARRRRGYF